MSRKSYICALALVLAASFTIAASSCGSDEAGKTATAETATKKEKKSNKDKTSKQDRTDRDRTATTGGDLPDAGQIQDDLIGYSIVDPHLGEWVFEDLGEFIEFDIVDSEVSRDADDFEVAEFVIDVKLEDINDGRQYNGQLNVTYERRAEDMPWRLIDVDGEYRSAAPSV